MYFLMLFVLSKLKLNKCGDVHEIDEKIEVNLSHVQREYISRLNLHRILA